MFFKSSVGKGWNQGPPRDMNSESNGRTSLVARVSRFLGVQERGHVTGKERRETNISRLQRDRWWDCVAVVSVSFQSSEGVTRGPLARLPRISRLAKGETEKTASRSRLPCGELGHFLCAFCTPLGLVTSIQICPDIQTSYHLVKQPISKVQLRRLGVIGKDTARQRKGLNC